MRSLLSLLALSALGVAGCARKEEPKDAVARIGDRVIDFTELHRSYTLHPQWKKGQTQLQAYLTQLDALIDQKLYAAEAGKLEMDRDSLMQGYLTFLKQKEMMRGLYRKAVRDKVQVSEAEAREAYEWSKKKVDFEYILARDSVRCAALARNFAGVSIDRIALPPDSSVRVGRHEAVKPGDFPPGLERAVFTARLHDVRGPIHVPGGFMAVKITGGTQEKFLSDNEFTLNRERMDHVVRDRKTDSLAVLYVAHLMGDKDLRLNAPVFWAVADHFFKRVQEAHLDPMKIRNVNVTSDELRLLEDDLAGMAGAAVATHKEGTLTVRDLMQALANMPGSLRPRVRTPENLKAAIGMIVRNQYLLKEAERQGLADDPEVLFEYRLQRDETLANAYYGRRRGEVRVTPEEVGEFTKRSRVSEEQVFFKFNMASLARDAKTDSVLKDELPRLKASYAVALDTARVRSLIKAPDSFLDEDPVRIYVREIFQ